MLKVEFEDPRQQRARTAGLESGHPKNLQEVIEKSNRDVRAAYAAKHCTTNNIEEFDDAIDFLSEKVHSIVRFLIPDGRTGSK